MLMHSLTGPQGLGLCACVGYVGLICSLSYSMRGFSCSGCEEACLVAPGRKVIFFTWGRDRRSEHVMVDIPKESLLIPCVVGSVPMSLSWGRRNWVGLSFSVTLRQSRCRKSG